MQSHLDVKRETARDLVFAARRFGQHRGLHDRMLNGTATFDRTVVAVRLADTGVSAGVVDDSYGCDLDGVRRMIAHRKRVTACEERAVFADRFFTIQPNLDGSRYRMWGEAPGIIGATIEGAIFERADRLHRTVGGLPSTGSQRRLDAFAAMAMDSLDGATSAGSNSPQVTVFVDARRDNPAETAAGVEYGPRVGPDALEQMLCTGRVRIVGLDDHGVPVVTSPAARAIPPAIRHVVAHRDGVCLIDGCTSRYRLDPDSPSMRRRLIHSSPTRGSPQRTNPP
ncbi:MAG: hypothetical protein BMS9Abin12_0594 [Acidimicrobiia bacterium]|nr:MAG: hypothetical protein BMS9Abin12_0594 [Acidimicrobiia bacterium]